MHKISIALAACSFFLLSQNSLAWSEYSDGPDSYSENYNSDTNYNDNYNYVDEQVVQESQREFYNEPEDTADYRTYADNTNTKRDLYRKPRHVSGYKSYSSRLPQQISTSGEKMIIIDPRVHAWGAYSSSGALIRSGLATAGAGWCGDLGRPCRTKTGSFRIVSLGDRNCYSKKFPVGEGGAPMPYCMYFNGGQALHGSYEVVDGNRSHGCVRVSVQDAQWIRFNFAQTGTRVVVKSY